MINDYLTDAKKLFGYYKSLGEKAMAHVSDDQLNWKPEPESNSIALIVKHLSGNMLSRWTNFLTSDGEKEWRNRDQEFEGEIPTREELMERWHCGWKCVFDAIEPLKETFLLFLRGNVQKKLANDDAVAREVALEVPDVMVALLPDVLCDELLRDLLFCQQLGMDADDQIGRAHV